MLFEPSALSVFLFITATLTSGLGIYALQKQTSSFARYYTGLMFCSAIYSLGYGLELIARNSVQVWSMLRIQYLGIPFIPFFWIGLAWSHLDPHGMPRRWHFLLLTISGSLCLLFQGNALHNQFYTSLDFSLRDGMTISYAGKGFIYWIDIAYLNLGTAVGVGLFFRAWRQAIALYRMQALVMLLGSLLPWLFHLLYQFKLSPDGIDLSPFGIAATGVAFAIASFRHNVLNVLPLARDIVFEGIAEGVIVLDTRLRIIDFNPAATHFFPALGPTLIGTSALALSDIPEFQESIHRDGQFIVTISGKQLEIRRYGLRGRHTQEIGTSLLIQDISERMALIDKLRKLATTDDLTGVCNRRHLMAMSEREVSLAQRHGRTLSAMIIDLDNFKEINDGQGHLAGDLLLRNVAMALGNRLRSTDILGRYGGDEFIITLPETSDAQAESIAIQLSHSCQSDCHVSLSIGIAELDQSTGSLSELLHRADLALYQAKSAGKNRVVRYTSSL